MNNLRNDEGFNGINHDDIFLQYPQYQQKKNDIGQLLSILTSFCIVICILVLLYCILTTDIITSKLPILNKLPKIMKKDAQRNLSLSVFGRRQNILLMGVDVNPDGEDPFKGTRSDTLILLSIDPKARSVNAVSIPRDSKVYIPGNHGIQKINSAHALGGIKLTIRTIEDTLGVPIDKYIAINNEAVVKIVDALGGVPVYVEKNMFYHDHSGNLNIELTKGLKVLNGKQAEGYLRYRKDGLGDIGRTTRQQWFLRSLLEKLQSPSTLSKIPEMLKIANTYVKTDMSLYEMSNFAALAKDIDIDKIEVATLPGAPSKKSTISYWILDPDKTQQVIDRMIYRKKIVSDDKAFTAGILFTENKKETAMIIKKKLEEMGYKVNYKKSKYLPHSQFIAHTLDVTNDFSNWVKQKIPELGTTQFVYDPLKMHCVNSDFTIVLSN